MAKNNESSLGSLSHIGLIVLGVIAVIAIVGLVVLLQHNMQLTGQAIAPMGECIMANGNVQPMFSQWQFDKISAMGFECKLI